MKRWRVVGVGMATVAIAACGGKTVWLGPENDTTDASADGASAGNGGVGATGGKGGTAGSGPSAGSGGASSGGAAGSSLGGQAGMPYSDSGVGGYAGIAGNGNPAGCGPVSCNAGEICCFATGKCFVPGATPSPCPNPTSAGDGSEEPTCGSDADCAPNGYCEIVNGCVGPGHCRSKSSCTYSGTPSCSCDGQIVDYHAACLAGVHVVRGPCGVPSTSGGGKPMSPCGNASAWCPAGEGCCMLTGYCYDTSQPLLCSVPPDGTYFPCVQDADCPGGTDYCVGPTCGSPGGCVQPPSASKCTGQWDPVCGCDGKTYVNAICAAVERVAVDYKGECSAGG